MSLPIDPGSCRGDRSCAPASSPPDWRSVLVLLMVMTLAATAAITLTVPASVASAQAGSPECKHVRVAVSLSKASPRDQYIAGQVCYPDGPDRVPGAIQVLVSGATYGGSYWDFPYQPNRYSYVLAANRAGFATFDFDRIGIGQSSHPASASVTIPSSAYTIHELIQDLRAGAIDGRHYTKVLIVGHSIGSLMAWYEAGTYHDVNGVAVTGVLHTFNTTGMAKFLATLYPAALDPKFAGKIFDPGYLTTLPGTRGASFYYPQDTNQKVVQIDEKEKQTATAGEAEGAFALELPGALRVASGPLCSLLPGACSGSPSSLIYGITRQISVPVLDVVGQYDPIFCGGPTGFNQCRNAGRLQKQESVYYTGIARRCLRVATLPGAGHPLNLELNAGSWFFLASTWSRSVLEHAGSGSGC